MQVTLNGKERGELDDGLERRLRVRKALALAEGEVLSADAAVALASRGLRLFYGAAAVVGGLVMIAALAAAAAYEPRDLVVVAPLAVAVVAVVWVMVVTAYRRNRRKVAARAETWLPQMPPAGAIVRVSDAGLELDGAVTPWTALVVGRLDVISTRLNDEQMTFIERMTLFGGAKPAALDIMLMTNGRTVIAQAWRHLYEAQGR